MAAADEEPPKLSEHVDEVLQLHQEQLMACLNAWLQSLDARLAGVQEPVAAQAPVLATASGPSLAESQKPAQESVARTPKRTESLESMQSAEIMTNASMNSYAQAMAAHERVVEESKRLQQETSNSVLGEPTSMSQCRYWAGRIVNSQCGNVFFALAVVTNSLLLGVTLEWYAVTREFSSGPSIFTTLNVLYSILFTLEVCLRLTAEGCRTYVWESMDWAWNWLDTFVVCSSWIELLPEFLSAEPGGNSTSTNSNLRILRLLRVGRLVRVVRVVRVVKFFRSLRTLVQSLLGTMKALFWALILLALIIYIFGIVFTDAVIDHARETTSLRLDDDLEESFGTLYSSAITLFRCISNGVAWSEPADALQKIPEGMVWVQFFHFYIAFCSFAVLNVMTGVFCNSAIKAAERDHEMLVLSHMQSRKELMDQVENLFHKIDKRGLGQVTIEDFEMHFDDDAVIAFFDSMEIGAMDAWTLFMGLDMDGDHTVSVEEFTERCVKLRGPARSADLFALRQLTDKHTKQLQSIEESQKRLDKRLGRTGRHAVEPANSDEEEVRVNWL